MYYESNETVPFTIHLNNSTSSVNNISENILSSSNSQDSAAAAALSSSSPPQQDDERSAEEPAYIPRRRRLSTSKTNKASISSSTGEEATATTTTSSGVSKDHSQILTNNSQIATISNATKSNTTLDSTYQSQLQPSIIDKQRQGSSDLDTAVAAAINLEDNFDFCDSSSTTSSPCSSSIDETPNNNTTKQHKSSTNEKVNNIKQSHHSHKNANNSESDKRNPLAPTNINGTRKKSLPQLLFSASDSLSSSSPPNLPIISTTSVFSSSSTPTTPSKQQQSSSDNTKVEFVLGDSNNSDLHTNANSSNNNMMKLIKKGSSSRRNSENKEHNLLSPIPGVVAGGNEKLLVLKSDVNHNHNNNNSHSSSLLSAEENFECLADGSESFFDSPSENTSLQFLRDANDVSRTESPGGSGIAAGFRRNSLLRTSLRNKSPQHSNNGDMGHRRWGSFRTTSGTKRPLGTSTPTSSNALATQLYRTSSFNSTGRSSTGDPEEMYSDGSLEDEVIDLTQKVHHLEEKFTVLAENQSDVDDRYTRAKQENSELSTKLFLLEEQLRDVEQRADDKVRNEQKRCKELLARLDREKQLQIENYDIKLQALEKELEHTKTESSRQKQQLERERYERIQASDKLIETEREISNLRDDNRILQEQARKERETLVLESTGSQQALQEFRKEFENLRRFQMANIPNGTMLNQHRDSLDGDINEIRSRLLELEEENKKLKQENKHFKETNEDLTAQVLNHGIEEGRQLLTLNARGLENSLAAEFEAMSEDEMKSALKEEKKVNDQLRHYIDGILLSIVENYPQLLEVKGKPSEPQHTPENVKDQRES